MSHMQIPETLHPVTVVTVRGEEFVFIRVRDLQPVTPHLLPPSSPQTVHDRGSLEMIKITLWIACAVFGLFLLVSILRSPVAPSTQPVVINHPPEKKRHTSKDCNATGFLGWNQVCNQREWWE